MTAKTCSKESTYNSFRIILFQLYLKSIFLRENSKRISGIQRSLPTILSQPSQMTQCQARGWHAGSEWFLGASQLHVKRFRGLCDARGCTGLRKPGQLDIGSSISLQDWQCYFMSRTCLNSSPFLLSFLPRSQIICFMSTLLTKTHNTTQII